MKRLSGILILGLLAGCNAYEVNTPLSACPLQGLRSATFYMGKPSAGNIIEPVEKKGTSITWEFRDGDTYVACHYEDGSPVIQRLASSVSSCRAEGNAGKVTRFICRANI